MKTIRIPILFTFILFTSLSFAQVGIGTSSPNTNAALDVEATDKGVMVPRLTNAEAATLATGLVAADDGLIIYNTDEKCIQFWDGVELEFVCAARVGGGAGGNAGVVKVNITGAEAARDATPNPDFTHPSFIGFGNLGGGNSFYPDGTFFAIGVPDAGNDIPGFTAADLDLSGFPTTNWPENTPVDNQNIDGVPAPSAIYRDNQSFTGGETGDAWLENDIPGQVHIWRINILGDNSSNSAVQFELRIRNPQSGFTSGYAQVVPASQGPYEQTFTITTIADNASLPVGDGSGTGNGYVIEMRTNAGAQGFWIESITRVSLYNE